jgi:hypothetical protein
MPWEEGWGEGGGSELDLSLLKPEQSLDRVEVSS